MGTIVLAAIAVIVAAFVTLASLVHANIPVGKAGLLYRNGRFGRELAPGKYHWFDPFRRIAVHQVDMTTRISGHHVLEVMSADRFSFRLTVVPAITVTDARLFREAAPVESDALWGAGDPLALLQPILADAMVKAVARRSLEEVLHGTDAVLEEAAAALAPALPGTRLDRLLLSAVTVPPEVRKMFTEVERAKQAGLANLERARSEQASLRALANAARNMSGNPELAKLRLWQLIEQANGQKTFVLGDTDRLPPSAEN